MVAFKPISSLSFFLSFFLPFSLSGNVNVKCEIMKAIFLRWRFGCWGGIGWVFLI